MSTKSAQPGPPGQDDGRRLLDQQVQVSESGQFTVSMDAVRELPSFRRDVNAVAQIRAKLQKKR